jgi:heme-degrading monooxygenase HmoA
MPRAASSAKFYRLDRFVVPDAAQEEFLARLHASQQFLRSLPGFLQDFALQQNAGNGMRHYVTLAEWTDAAAVDVARAAIHAWYASTQLDPQELFARLGVTAELGNYFPVKASGR